MGNASPHAQAAALTAATAKAEALKKANPKGYIAIKVGVSVRVLWVVVAVAFCLSAFKSICRMLDASMQLCFFMLVWIVYRHHLVHACMHGACMYACIHACMRACLHGAGIYGACLHGACMYACLPAGAD